MPTNAGRIPRTTGGHWLALALLFGFAALAGTDIEAGSRTDADEQVLWGSVASTIDEGERRAAQISDGRPRILLLSHTLVAGRGERISGSSSIRERLIRLADQTGLVVGAPIIEQSAGQAGDRPLAVTLVAPGNPMLARSYAVMPVVPVAGVTFARGSVRNPLSPVNIHGFSVGIAAIGDAEAAIPRLGDRGVSLVLLTGGPTSREQVERFAEAARASRVALLIAGRCTSASSCVAAAGVDADGRIDWAVSRDHAFVRWPRWSPPSAKGLPNAIPQPSRYDHSPAVAELGRVLFFDKRISETGSIACASCHDPALGFSDGRRLGAGVLSRTTTRNVISLLNVAFRPALRWDSYASSLENFVKYPMSGHDEMASDDLDDVLSRIDRSPPYRARFAAAFGTGQIQFEMVERALAAYMRTLVSGNSLFDRATVGGQPEAMTESAWRGYRLFSGRAGCATCHAYSEDSPFFTDFQAHNTGLGWRSAAARYRDLGAGAITDAQPGSFRTPTLRDVARTGPYMHDGSMATLREVIDYFDRGGGDGPGRDPRLRALHLSDRDKRDLEAFLVALTGTTRFDASGRRLDQQLAGAR
jgi:cytochrome c peroxidase